MLNDLIEGPLACPGLGSRSVERANTSLERLAGRARSGRPWLNLCRLHLESGRRRSGSWGKCFLCHCQWPRRSGGESAHGLLGCHCRDGVCQSCNAGGVVAVRTQNRADTSSSPSDAADFSVSGGASETTVHSAVAGPRALSSGEHDHGGGCCQHV